MGYTFSDRNISLPIFGLGYFGGVDFGTDNFEASDFGGADFWGWCFFLRGILSECHFSDGWF